MSRYQWSPFDGERDAFDEGHRDYYGSNPYSEYGAYAEEQRHRAFADGQDEYRGEERRREEREQEEREREVEARRASEERAYEEAMYEQALTEQPPETEPIEEQ